MTRTAIPLHDFWCIDFDECEIANITMPNGLFYNPDFKLDKKKCSKHLIVSDDGLTVESIQGPDCKPAAVKATLPFVPAANYSVAYFEVTILDVGESRLRIHHQLHLLTKTQLSQQICIKSNLTLSHLPLHLEGL